MSETKNSATFTFGYTNTDFTRQYKVDNLAAASLGGIKSGVLALNASLAAGTAGGISSFFISDDFNAASGTGYFKGIVAAQAKSTEETVIPLFD